MTQATLITESYRDMQRDLHRNPEYGTASVEYAPLVAEVMQAVGTRELLDYGAGKGRLGLTLNSMFDEKFTIHHYDPAIPEWSAPPAPCGFVACIDVLEHIEPDLIDDVLDDLKRVTAGFALVTVDTLPARKTLVDGRNAHLIQQPASWWLLKFIERFEPVKFERQGGNLLLLVERRADGA